MASSLTQPSLGYLVVRPATLQVDALRLGQFFRTNDDILYVKSAEGERWVIGDDLLIKVKFIVTEANDVTSLLDAVAPSSHAAVSRSVRPRRCAMYSNRPSTLNTTPTTTSSSAAGAVDGSYDMAFDEDDELNMRCCKGWGLVAQVDLRSAPHTPPSEDGDDSDTESDDVSNPGLLSLGSVRVPIDAHVSDVAEVELLDPTGIVCGFLSVTLEYYPNHQDMLALSRDCALQADLPRLLTEELLKSVQELKPAAPNASYIAQLERAVNRFYTCISHGKMEAIMARHLKDSLGSNFDELSHITDLEHVLSDVSMRSPPRRDVTPSSPVNRKSPYTSPVLRGEGDMTSPPDVVEAFRVNACTRHLLHYLLKEFKLFTAPDPSVELVEKLLALYMHAMHELLDSKRLLRDSQQSNNSSSGVKGGRSKGPPSPPKTEGFKSRGTSIRLIDQHIRFPVFVEFAIVASLWFLQHVFLCVSLNSDCSISSTEITAIWQRFERFDPTLSGYIASKDLILLLQDMGDYYLPDEIDVILGELDPDHLGIVEFSSFIEWWSEA